MKTLNKSSQPLQMGIDKLWSRQEKPGAHVPGEEYTHRKLRGRSAMNIFPKCLKTLCLSLALVCAVGLTACNGTEESEEPACGDGIVQPERGEECDNGAHNGDNGSCLADCTLASKCAIDETIACADVECGVVQVVDACGLNRNISCGACEGEGLICHNNSCVPGCDLSVAELELRCQNKCGVIETPDACGQIKSINCGENCGDGLACNHADNTCVAPEQCAIDTAPYCETSTCGAATAIDNCGQKIFFDCSESEGVDVIDPLQDFTKLGGFFIGPTVLWDAAGAYRVGIVEQGDAMMYLLVDASLELNDSGELSAVTTTADGSLDSCETEFCAFVVKQSDSLDYWFDSVAGTATILSVDPLKIQFSDVYFSEYISSYYGQTCLTSPVDFLYAQGQVCEPDGLNAFDQASFGEEEIAYGYQAPAHYTLANGRFDYDQVVYYLSTDDVFVYAEINNYWRDNAEWANGLPLNTPIAINTNGGFSDDGYPYCNSQSCLMFYTGAQYNAYEGEIVLTARDDETGFLAGSVSNARFYMADVTTMAPMECATPPVSFSFETSSGTYTDEQGSTRTYFTDYTENYDWSTACLKKDVLQNPVNNDASLSGKTIVLAEQDEQGWSELEFISDAFGDAQDLIMVNVNNFYDKAPPFVNGRLEPVENVELHPLASDWVIQDGVPYCYSPICIGYINSGMLYSPVAGKISVSKVDTGLAGSATDLLFASAEAFGEEGELIVCLHEPLSFSFAGDISTEN